MNPATIVRIALIGLLAAILFSGCTTVNPPTPKVVVTSPTTVSTTQPASPAQTSSAAPADNVAPGGSLTVIPVADKRYRTVALKPTTGYSSIVVADNGRVYLACGAQKQSEMTGVCMIDPATGSEMFLVDPRQDNAKLGAVTGDGDWAVYAQMDPPQRIMAINTATKEQVEVGKITAGTLDSPVGLAFAISGSRIVWVDEAENQDQKRFETIMLFDLKERTNRALTTLQPTFVVDQIDLDGDTVVWSQVDTSDMAQVTSNVYAYDLATDKLRALSEDGRASMPHVYDHLVVWKTTATRFAYGSVYLYDLTTGTGQEIAKAEPEAGPVPLGYDAPSIGSEGVTWISSRNDKIELYHPDTGQTEVFDQGGGRAFTEGHYMIWVNDTVTQKGDWHLIWSDLSAATGGPAGGQPAATPAPSAAPATATPLPAQQATAAPTATTTGGDTAPDGAAWETFTSPNNDYRLRYPTGSAITSDQLNNATIFTLTRDQATYTTRVAGPLPIPAGAQTPADVLGAADQSLGTTSSQPQPITLGGLGNVAYQAAAITTTRGSDQPGCSTQQTRSVAVFAHDSAFMLHFEVAGPGQCDATQVALFEAMLQSFALP